MHLDLVTCHQMVGSAVAEVGQPNGVLVAFVPDEERVAPTVVVEGVGTTVVLEVHDSATDIHDRAVHRGVQVHAKDIVQTVVLPVIDIEVKGIVVVPPVRVAASLPLRTVHVFTVLHRHEDQGVSPASVTQTEDPKK